VSVYKVSKAIYLKDLVLRNLEFITLFFDGVHFFYKLPSNGTPKTGKEV